MFMYFHVYACDFLMFRVWVYVWFLEKLFFFLLNYIEIIMLIDILCMSKTSNDCFFNFSSGSASFYLHFLMNVCQFLKVLYEFCSVLEIMCHMFKDFIVYLLVFTYFIIILYTFLYVSVTINEIVYFFVAKCMERFIFLNIFVEFHIYV